MSGALEPHPAAAAVPPVPELSVVIIARDEEARIGACLDAVAFAGERLVADTGSRDRTRAVAAAHGARVVEVEWRGFGLSKRAALELAAGDWLLLLDADEVVDARLARAIAAAVREPGAACGFELCRRALFLGRWLGHGGWYPDWVLRLVRRGAYTMSADAVHEQLRARGPASRLAGELLHYTDPELAIYLRKMNRYADLGAQALRASGRRFHLHQLLVHPPAIFIKRYLLLAGFLDGFHGLLLAALSAVHVLLKYARLWELEQQAAGEEDGRRRPG